MKKALKILVVVLAAVLLIGGSIQLSLGIIGQYLARTYLETKRRPIYIVSETEADIRAGKGNVSTV